MPIGRMLNKKISYDERLCELSLETVFVFTWIIPHLDVKGRILGDSSYIKATVFPLIDKISAKKIENALIELKKQNLIIYYGNKIKYIEFTGFRKNQRIDEKKEAKSTIPEPDLFNYSSETPELLQRNSRHKIKINIKDKIKVKINEKEEEPALSDDNASNPLENNIDNKPEPKKKKDFIDECLDVWKDEYSKNRNNEYEFVNRGKDREGIGKLVALLRRKHIEISGGSPPGREVMLEKLRITFQHVLKIEDNYFRNNLTPMLLVSKFNEINNILKNGNGKAKTGITDDHIKRIIEEEFNSS